MTPGRMRLLVAAGAVLTLAGAFWGSYRYGAGRLLGVDPALAGQADAARGVLLEVRALRERRATVVVTLDDVANSSLGNSLAVVDSSLRTRLNRLGESEKLRNLAVGTGANAAHDSPARGKYGRSAEQRGLRDEIDFVELQGWVNGDGTPAQILRLVQRIDAEPWLHRIDSIKLEAVGIEKAADAPRLRASIRLTTLFLPGRTATAELASSWTKAEADRLAPLLERTLFALPVPAPPVVAVQAAPPTAPVAPPPFPYEEWQLTGVARGPTGPEVWLQNRRSGERRTLVPGQSLSEMTLVEAGGETAFFTVSGQRVRVAVGSSMHERSPLG